MWKLPNCSIGMDISNHGEEQLHTLKSGRSGMSLTLQASSAWSADIQKPMKQSRVNFNNWWHFLRKRLEPSRTFFFSQLVLQSSPCLLEHKVMHLFRCSSERHRSKGDSLRLCDRRCYSSSTVESKGGSPQTSTFVSSFLSLVHSSALDYKASRGGAFCQLQKETVSKNKIQLQLVLAPCKSCTAMYCN